MKLNEFDIDVLWEGKLDGEDYAFVIEEGRMGFTQRNTRGSIQKVGSSILKFAKNPVVAAIGAGYAYNAYQKYKKNKRTTTTFFAKDMQERKLYKSIVDDLMKTGKYKKVKEKFVDGGVLYVLKRAD